MGLCLYFMCEFLEECELAGEVEVSAGTALEGGACFIVEGALHLSIATAIDLIVVIHFCNYNGMIIVWQLPNICFMHFSNLRFSIFV